MSAADGLARSVDPSAQLANLTVMKALGGGRLDLGSQDAMVVLTYRSISSMVLVRASATELGATRADATQGLQLVTRDASCTFKRAYDVALGTEFKNAPDAFASLIFNPQLGLSVYQFHSPTGHALIDAKTCTVRTQSSR